MGTNRTCSIDGCGRPHMARGWCMGHYGRWRKSGDPGPAEIVVRRQEPVCTVEGCELDSTSLGLCWAHYYRQRRKGEPGPAEVKHKNPGALCAMAGCDDPAKGYGYCLKHYTRVKRHGDPTVVLPCWNYGERNGSWKGDDASYNAIHSRLRTAYGPASMHQCVECGHSAVDWSYNHTALNEYISDSGPSRGCAYSTDTEDYSPRCRPCHKRFDMRPATSNLTACE